MGALVVLMDQQRKAVAQDEFLVGDIDFGGIPGSVDLLGSHEAKQAENPEGRFE